MNHPTAFPRYDSYLDSGIDWLGLIPSGWKLQRLATVFEERKEKVSDKDFPPLSVTKNGVVPQLDSAAKSDDGDNRKGVREGDFVINSRSDRKGSSGIAKQDGSVSLINIVLKPKGIAPRYSEHLLKSNGFIEEFYRNGHGIVADLWTTRYWDMKSIHIPLPDIATQDRIANFLDQKSAEIDETIAKKQRLIELLKEQKAILTNQAVTKGLNPDAPMRDSGVEWIGEVPRHWEVKKIKAALKNLDNRRIPLSSSERGKMTEHLYDYYGASGAIDKVADYLFDEPLILVAEDGANLVMRNLKLAFIATGKYWVNNHAHILKPIEGDIDYLCNALECVDYNPYITGAAQPKLTKEAIKNVYLPYPPSSEQKQIAEKLSVVCQQVTTQHELVIKEIGLLNELKQILINNAVTGKIKI